MALPRAPPVSLSWLAGVLQLRIIVLWLLMPPCQVASRGKLGCAPGPGLKALAVPCWEIAEMVGCAALRPARRGTVPA